MSQSGCPICSKPTATAYRPFCSRRCADVDLQRWLSGAYAVPAVEGGDGPGEEPVED
ncbi:DNA gyrase inhibitor YacG [Phenylobacterium deserti]|uniref:DNA gyrase inhibitor YacG n=1 Tax=Phenylobacterium deserti TaxID=1914756 RepID=A0A328AID8_9CAUL|nr:DNA gyrase inhibitor YacG [Phenylobacterium deserti]RAK52608.1 DNA gyrase inhibitor YacG [Phenylobacterium deserti]